MLVRFLRWAELPRYHGVGEIMDMPDAEARALMKEHPGVIEEYDPRTEAKAEAAALVDSDRPKVITRLATGLKKA